MPSTTTTTTTKTIYKSAIGRIKTRIRALKSSGWGGLVPPQNMSLFVVNILVKNPVNCAIF